MATTVREYTTNIRDTVRSIWHGLSITLSYLARRPVTVQYPDRTELPVRDMLPPRYRGFLEVDIAICTGCQACERACPIGCMQITLEKDPANPKQRVVTQFDIDEAKCMFCGLCVEPCPTGSIQHTREFEGSRRNIRNLVLRWADPEKGFPVYKVDKNAEYYPRAPLGSLIRAKLDQKRWDAAGPVFLPPAPPKPPEEKKPAAAKPAAAAAAKPAAAAAPAAKPATAAAPAVTAIPTSPPTATATATPTATPAAPKASNGAPPAKPATPEGAVPATGAGATATTKPETK
jgi:NADH-quinone oxidoreductase subunit I